MPAMIPRILIQPPLFWAATKDMLPDQIDALWDRLERFIAQGDTKSLQHYDFAVVEHLDSAA